jgi:hypothetical protein
VMRTDWNKKKSIEKALVKLKAEYERKGDSSRPL